MVIEATEFLDLYLAVMKKNEIKAIRISDIPEVIRILYASKEFEMYSRKLKIEKIAVADLEDHRFAVNIDPSGVFEFSMPDDEFYKIMMKNPEDTRALTNAINKRAVAGYTERISGGTIAFKYDDPDGKYVLPCILNEPANQCETRIFTDGKIVSDTIRKNHDMYTMKRDVEIKESTYTIMIDYKNDIPEAAEVRALTQGDLIIISEEAKQLMRGRIESYDTNNEIPRSYTLRRH